MVKKRWPAALKTRGGKILLFEKGAEGEWGFYKNISSGKKIFVSRDRAENWKTTFEPVFSEKISPEEG